MNGSVISLDAHRPHLEGPARCGGCQHKYHAVAPIGTATNMECPSCHRMLAVFVNHVLRGSDDTLHWVCKCGCDMFHISEHGTYCASCGAWKMEAH